MCVELRTSSHVAAGSEKFGNIPKIHTLPKKFKIAPPPTYNNWIPIKRFKFLYRR
jgi:hypothetical protein